MSTLDRYQYGYDGNSNRLYKANVVGTPIVSGGLDELYSYDNLNRLIVMQRGTLNGTNTGITGTPSREMDYTLDPTGNWSSYLTKTSGTTDLNQTRTANKVNEITAIGGTPGWATPPAYDAAGNMTTMPQPETPGSAFTTTYDAWNRMTSISDSGGTVASYQYDGMNRRTVKTTTATSETRHFYYKAWQDIEERVGSSTSADQQYVWGIRYVDELVCRDDPTNGRLYAMQDANFNLTSICDTSATVKERYYYDPYGNRSIMDGSWSSIGTSAYNWVIGHQGLMIDQESGLIYNRNRMLHPELGRFIRRDPSRYINGLNLYLYLLSNPTGYVDANGTAANPTTQPTTRPTTGPTYTGPLGQPTWKDLQPKVPVPADCSPDCGLTIMNAPGVAGHRWIQLNFGNGTIPVGAGFYPSGWNSWNPPTGRPIPTPVSPSGGTTTGPWIGFGDPHTGTPGTASPLTRSPFGSLKFGSGAGVNSATATCQQIQDCIAKFVPSHPTYCAGWNDCWNNADEALGACGMKYANQAEPVIPD